MNYIVNERKSKQINKKRWRQNIFKEKNIFKNIITLFFKKKNYINYNIHFISSSLASFILVAR
jgi:ABC-type transport system involved in multi-copper enzyme maturation permease subunit